MSRCVDFYFDVGSPASYLAWTQLPDMARSLDARINWKPILLGGLFQATGNQSPAANPAKGQYLFTDLSRYACLLYTSPSPRDRQKSRMPSSA